MANYKTPDLSIVIPTYNRDSVLLDTIRDCLKQKHKNIEVLVIDQTVKHTASFEKELATINDDRLHYYYVDPPRVTAAKNFALARARARYALFLDDDVAFDSYLVDNYLAAIKKHPEVSAIAGRVLQKGFPIQEDVLRFDDLAVSHGVFTATKPAFTNAFPGGNSVLKIKDALRVGGFDTRYYKNAFREESDMSMKMFNAGMKIYFEPKAVLTHLAAHSGGSRTNSYTDIRDTKMFYRNELFFTLRYAKHKKEALHHKYDEYCEHPDLAIKRRRTLYFYLGILAAYWRMWFVGQKNAVERKK